MKKNLSLKLFAFIIAIAFVSFSNADVHPGLKKAIDDGDYKTAKNLIEKMNIKDVYGPATLSVKDAEYIYSSLDYGAVLLCHYPDCEPKFKDNYFLNKCSSKKKEDIKGCLIWLDRKKPTELQQHKDLFCKNKQTLETCSLYVEKQPVEVQYQILKELDKKNLVEFNSVVDVDTVVKQTLSPQKCIERANASYSSIKSSIEIYQKYSTSQAWLNGSLICFFDGSRNAVNKCIAKLDAVVKEIKKDCKSGKLKIEDEVRIKKKEKKAYSPFKKALQNISQSTVKPWSSINDSIVSVIKFCQKFTSTKYNEDFAINYFKKKYSTESKLSISALKKFCIMHPDLGEKIEKKYGVKLFSCKDIFRDYPHLLNEPCEVRDSTWVKYYSFNLFNNDSFPVYCDKRTGKYRYINYFEKITGKNCENSDSSWTNTYYDGKDSITVVCDIATGNFRKLSYFEKKVGLCNSDKEGIEVGPFVCKNGSWLNTKYHDTENITFEEGKLYRGETDTNRFYFKDFRDNQVYRAAKLGNHIWMAENLNYADSVKYSSLLGGGSICYSDYDCEIFGRLYSRGAAMDKDGSLSSNGSECDGSWVCHPSYPVRGICPEGWHLPDSTEWKELYEFVGRNPTAMQAKGFAEWENATDDFYLSILPIGFCDPNHFINLNASPTFRVSCGYDYSFSLSRQNIVPNDHYTSVRCIKDSE